MGLWYYSKHNKNRDLDVDPKGVPKKLRPWLRLHTLAGFGKTLAPEATAIADELLQRGLQPLALDA